MVKLLAGPRDQTDGVERRDRAGREEEQPRHVARMLAAKPPAQDPQSMNTQTNRPTDSSTCQIRREVQVLEPLQAEPVRGGVPEHAVHAQERADQRPEYDDGESAEQREGELALVPRLAAGDHRRQEDPGGDERGRHPEQRQLHVPGAHQVVREQLREVDAEEARRSRRGSAAVAAPTNVWIRNSAAITKKNHAVARWAGVSATSPGERNESVACSRPCQPRKRPRAEDAEQQADPAEQGDQRQHAPDHHVRGRLVVDARLRRPVVRVGVVVARSVRRRRPTPSTRRTRSAGELDAGR